jgi:hypothetical protein
MSRELARSDQGILEFTGPHQIKDEDRLRALLESDVFSGF